MTDIVSLNQIYIGVSDLTRSEAFYDRAMRVLGYRKTRFALNREPRIEYFSRDAGYVLQPASSAPASDAARQLRPVCLHVDSPTDVGTVASRLRAAGIAASEPAQCAGDAPEYWATFFTDPDGQRLEVSNCRHDLASSPRI